MEFRISNYLNTMKILYLSFLLCFFSVTYGFSQSISVSSFKLLESDLTANTAGTIEKDQNGEVAALIKVVTTQTGFSFDSGSLGIVKTRQTPGEIWVYIPGGAKKISIKHPQLGVLRDYYFPISIESARTYEMVLISGTVQTVVQQARTSQFVVFQLNPINAQVELDGDVLETIDGTATKMLKFGTYNYRVQAPYYLAEAGSITINDPKNKKIVNISLKPNFSEVTIKVDNDAEIWINGTKKGNGTWTGNLGRGTYEFEAKKDGYKSTLMSKDIIVTSVPQIINLQTPTPIYGEAEIDSKPAMADIYIDGKEYGQTPSIVSDVIIGSHQLRITKKGYSDYSSNIIIKEGETVSVNAQLNKAVTPAQTSTRTTNIQPEGKVFDVVQQMPKFPGGDNALFQWMSNNLQYPVKAAENGIQGRVIVSFVVELDGSINDVKVIRSVDSLLDKEAIRLVRSMPRWIPGKNDGQTVRVNYSVPVTFRIQ